MEIMEQTPDIPAELPVGVFLRNHDELTLEMVTDRRARLYVPELRDRSRMRASTSASAAVWRRCWTTTGAASS